MCIKEDGVAHHSRSGHKVRMPTEEEKQNHQDSKKNRRAKLDSKEYVFNFGKHKGLSLEEVWNLDMKYFAWILENDVGKTRPDLKEAMRKFGLQDATPTNLHREIVDQDMDEMAIVPASSNQEQAIVPVRKRKYISKAVTQPHNCSICGALDHNRSSCPRRTGFSEVQRKALVEAAYKKAGQEAKQLARRKYTAEHQRSIEYTSRPKGRSRAAVDRSWLELSRASAGGLAIMMVENGILKILMGSRALRVHEVL